MKKICLYEFITGGGCLHLPDDTLFSGSLHDEGEAMRSALVDDLQSSAKYEVHNILDYRLKDQIQNVEHPHWVSSATEELKILEKVSSECDLTIVIAPETEGALVERNAIVTQAGGNLFADLEIAKIATSKSETNQMLAKSNIPVPKQYSSTEKADLPLICKPDDGAGTIDTFLIQSESGLQKIKNDSLENTIIESWVEGQAVSCIVLVADSKPIYFVGCTQVIKAGSHLQYAGGEFPVKDREQVRIRRLAQQVIECLNPRNGYYGIDMVLGAAADGSEDVVIEVNPRWTTSYIALKEACKDNLTAKILDFVFEGEAQFDFDMQPIHFTSIGCIYESHC